MKDIFIVNLHKAIEEGKLEKYLPDIAAFKSRDNLDVEKFLKEKSVNSCRMKQSVTYLAYNKERENWRATLRSHLKL